MVPDDTASQLCDLLPPERFLPDFAPLVLARLGGSFFVPRVVA